MVDYDRAKGYPCVSTGLCSEPFEMPDGDEPWVPGDQPIHDPHDAAYFRLLSVLRPTKRQEAILWSLHQAEIMRLDADDDRL